MAPRWGSTSTVDIVYHTPRTYCPKYGVLVEYSLIERTGLSLGTGPVADMEGCEADSRVQLQDGYFGRGCREVGGKGRNRQEDAEREHRGDVSALHQGRKNLPLPEAVGRLQEEPVRGGDVILTRLCVWGYWGCNCPLPTASATG